MQMKSRTAILLASLLLLGGLACNIFEVAGGVATEPPAALDYTGKPILPSDTSAPTDTPTITPNATATPTITRTPVPQTATLTSTPSATITSTSAPGGGGPHFPPIIIATLIFVQPINPTLDYTANPNYGTASLSAGFSPDPYTVGMTSGGGVDVSYLGSSCSGFATSAPDFRVNFGGGGATLLRIYFIGSTGDTTLVVNDPYGNFYCVDDSFGTVNPTIDFNNPAGGTYDIWIGSYAQGTSVSGTLYITGNSGNHP